MSDMVDYSNQAIVDNPDAPSEQESQQSTESGSDQIDDANTQELKDAPIGTDEEINNDPNTSKDTVEGEEPEVLEDSDDAEDVKYKSLVDEALSPIKANGQMVTPSSIEDLRTLASKGLGFEHKAKIIKPAMKKLKILHKNNIDDDRLNLLIDVSNGNKDAIAKLLKDNSIDPIDVDVDTEDKYEATNHDIDDVELELSDKIDSIKDSEHFASVSNIVSSVWDDSSREIIKNDPTLIVKLNEEFEIGRFDKIQQIVQNERAFNRLGNMSDIEAYVAVLNQVMKQDKLKNKTTKKPKTTNDKSGRDSVAEARSLVGSSKKSTKQKDRNEMSDDEFLAELRNMRKKK